MRNLGLNALRKEYLDFFERKGHLIIDSASLVPVNDKSLLLIAAGMAPLKPYFTGQEQPPRKRLVSCQKCVRTNDIENVGVTSRHGTFFEMLGNFSFGDYFKEEAIKWAWEFLTEVLEIPEERLFPSVYHEDDEAFAIWRDKMNIPEQKISKLGKDENFWEHGAGPCGPCSEIYYDRGLGSAECDNPNCAPGCDCDRFVEVWNLVFTQFNKNEDGSYSPLEQRNIDTGMGLDRTACVLQGVNSIFDTDVMKAVRDGVCAEGSHAYGESPATDKSIRIITDHARAVTFMLSDGIMPSNEGRGYVLRKLLRRAALHGKLLKLPKGFFSRIYKTVIKQYEAAYPELGKKRHFISEMIATEENQFHERLEIGMDMIKKIIQATRETLTPAVLGEKAFVLYDTFGFPAELTQEILIGEGIEVKIDMDAFDAEMRKQRERARGARKESNFMGAEETALSRLPADMATEFIGYNENCADNTEILAVIRDDDMVDMAHDGCDVIIIPARTPMYAESGGQKGDSGIIETETGAVLVNECKRSGSKIAHYGRVIRGMVAQGQKAAVKLAEDARMDTARNHTATHLLHKALKHVVGSHVEQAGSLVSSERLRFDFTHFKALSEDELREAEREVNTRILAALPITITETTPQNAREMGAVALFGEKYGDIVRVVSMGDYSMELCGGTHLVNTASAGMFKIISESGIAAGVRRIEAVTGLHALEYVRGMESRIQRIAAILKSDPDGIPDKLESLLSEKAEFVKELNKLKRDMSRGIIDELLAAKEVIGEYTVIAAEIPEDTAREAEARRELADALRGKLGQEKGIVLLLFKNEDGGYAFLSACTSSAAKADVHCGNIIRDTVKGFGGRGGGKPDMAQGGIPAGVNAGAVLEAATGLISF